MKTYIERNYSKNIKECDLEKMATYYDIPIRDIKENKRDEVGYESLDDIVSIDGVTLSNSEYVEDTSNAEFCEFDKSQFEDIIHNLMNWQKYYAFLIIGFNSNWRGQTGYKIVGDYNDIFFRDYEVSFYATGSNSTGKYLKLKEYSHDVPTGHTTLVIGLVKKEYDRIKKMEFDQIIKFGEKCLERVIDI